MYILFVTYVKYEMMGRFCEVLLVCPYVVAAAKLKEEVRFRRMSYLTGWNLTRENEKGAKPNRLTP